MSVPAEAVNKPADMVYPEVDRRLSSGRILDLLSFMGPGMILASVTIGNGEIFGASRGGAVFGYTMLWAFVIGAVMKAIVVYSGGRYIVLTGEHPFQRFGSIIPGPPGIFKHWLALLLGVLAVICFPAWMAAFMSGLGQLTNWVFGVDVNPVVWGIIWVLLAWGSLFVAGYSKVETFQTIVVLIMVIFSFIAVGVAGVNFGELVRGIVPSIPSGYEGWVVQNFPDVAARPVPLEVIVYLGMVGGGTYDYIGYLGTFREKGWGMLGNPNIEQIRIQLLNLKKTDPIPLVDDEENLTRARQWLRAPIVDTTTSFTMVTLFTLTFVSLGAVILGTGAAEVVPGDQDILRYQAGFFTQIHPLMEYYYQLAVWAAFFGSMQAAMTTVYPHTVREAFAPAFPALNLDANWRKIRIGVASYCAFAAIILQLTGASYVTVISFAGILGGVLSIGIWGFAQIYTDHKMLPKQLRTKPISQVLTAISALTLFIMGGVALLQFFGVM